MISLGGGLLWKEWRQLRLLRLGGASLIFLVPLLLLACAEAAHRGWLPLLGTVASYSVATVIQSAVPLVLSLAVWPLLALMIAAQCFCGDRASGTESFWIERPVSPRRVWVARISACLGSLGLILGVHLAVWWCLVLVWGDRRAFDTVDAGTRWLLMGDLGLNSVAIVVLLGLLLGLAALASGVAAASFVRSPMQALLLGIVLGVLPLALGEVLASSYPNARLGGTPLGTIFSLLLFPAYIASSYLAACRGEPAGRGRTVRGLAVIVAAAVLIFVLTPPVSAWVSQRVAVISLGNASISPSPAGGRLFVRNFGEGSAWLIDSVAATELERFPPHVMWAAWEPDGNRLAMVRAMPRSLVLDVIDSDGSSVIEGLDCGRCDGVDWAGGQIVFRTRTNTRWGLRLVDPDTGEARDVTGLREAARPYLLGPTSDGAHFVMSQSRSGSRGGDDKPVSLAQLDPASAAIGTEVVTLGNDLFADVSTISPSGRFCVVGGTGSWRIVDLGGGPDVTTGGRPVWMRADEPVWAEKLPGQGIEIFAGAGASRRELRTFPAALHATLRPSPDRARLLVALWKRDPSAGADIWVAEHWIYQPIGDSWTGIDAVPGLDVLGQPTRLEWAGRETLAVVGAGVLALRTLEEPGEPRFIIGG